MAKGKLPPFLARGAAPKAARPTAPPPRRGLPPEGSPAEEALDRQQDMGPAFRKGGSVKKSFGQFPKGKVVR
jgi:hypothetical protein